jgi:hypothetical protein
MTVTKDHAAFLQRRMDDIQKLHPTAQVEKIKNNQLYLVKYPGLTLAVSFKTLIAFCVADEWHISTEKSEREMTTKHQYHLRNLFRITHWYKTRQEFLAAFKTLLNNSHG